ncbi:hypothetical protein TNCV_2762051 [Trichonephila clavipes]|nr:hypothetical protein TNCV_2762051 [Trichonephila clavipes]
MTIALPQSFHGSKLFLSTVRQILHHSCGTDFQNPLSVLGCHFPKARCNEPKAQKFIGDASDHSTGILSKGIYFTVERRLSERLLSEASNIRTSFFCHLYVLSTTCRSKDRA